MSVSICDLCDLNIFSHCNNIVRCLNCQKLIHQSCISLAERYDPTKYKCKSCNQSHSSSFSNVNDTSKANVEVEEIKNNISLNNSIYPGWFEDYYIKYAVPLLENLSNKLQANYNKLDRKTIQLITSVEKLEARNLSRDEFAILQDSYEIKITVLPKGLKGEELDRAISEIFKVCDCSRYVSRIIGKRSWGFSVLDSSVSTLVVKLESRIMRDVLVLGASKLRKFNGKKSFGHAAERKIRLSPIWPKETWELLCDARSEMKNLNGPAPIVHNLMVFMRIPNDADALSPIFSINDLKSYVFENRSKYTVNQNN